MRTILSLSIAMTVLTGAIAIPSPAGALEYPWCAQYGGDHGGTNCGFSTFEQCEAALSGNAGLCDRNPFYAPPPPPGAKVRTPPAKRG